VSANALPGGRDIRDPKLVELDGTLFLYAISRLPGFHDRDAGGEAWTVRAESAGGGRTWTPPVKRFADVDAPARTRSGLLAFSPSAAGARPARVGGRSTPPAARTWTSTSDCSPPRTA
jgi:hypothetical protein